MKAIILAGGIGSRLWPLSRQKQPKQFSNIVNDQPLILDIFDRLRLSFEEDDIYFSINPAFYDFVKKIFPNVKDSHIIVEPEKRDTGPAMGYVSAILELQDPNEPIVFIPSDHYIEDSELFLRSLKVGEELINKTGKLLDIAITPTFPSTVLGYTKIGQEYLDINGIHVFNFAGHKEKPELSLAEKYIQSGDYLWHANYYMWTPRLFMRAFEKYAPSIGGGLRKIQHFIQNGQEELVESEYKKLEKISIDYAITEKMDMEDVLIIRGDFGWSDIGAWDTLQDRLSDGQKNVIKGNCIEIDTQNSLIYAPQDKTVAVVGLQNIIVVDTGDTLLVCHKDHAQKVKNVVEELKNRKEIDIL